MQGHAPPYLRPCAGSRVPGRRENRKTRYHSIIDRRDGGGGPAPLPLAVLLATRPTPGRRLGKDDAIGP